MGKISTLVGLYNNLDYTQHFYKTFREVYPTEELVFVSYGSEQDTGIWLNLISSIDPNVIVYWENKRKTFSDTYNKAIELATKEYVVFAHNDIVVAPGFLENLEKHTHKDRVVSYTTIEPPIFSDHERPGKIIKDFGSDLEIFKINDMKSFSKGTSIHYKDQISEDISFFMCLSRQILLDMGGFDNIFNPYFCEDDDLIRRLKLQGLNYFTSLDSIVYHFVSKTSRFSEEAKKNTQQIEQNSQKIYLKKWGSYNSNNKFDIGFLVSNNDSRIDLSLWCNDISANDDLTNDIIVSLDMNKLTQNSFEIIKNLQNILGDITEPGIYEIDIFIINVSVINNKINELIKIK